MESCVTLSIWDALTYRKIISLKQSEVTAFMPLPQSSRTPGLRRLSSVIARYDGGLTALTFTSLVICMPTFLEVLVQLVPAE
jgi:hypothetical protein